MLRGMKNYLHNLMSRDRLDDCMKSVCEEDLAGRSQKSIHEFPEECNPFRFNKSQNIELIAHRRFHWCIAKCSSQQQLSI